MRKTPKQFYYPGLTIQQEISVCQLPDLKGVGHWSWAWSHTGHAGVFQSLLFHISATKSLWKVQFDTIKANHIQNVICPAVVVILALKNQLFDNTGIV